MSAATPATDAGSFVMPFGKHKGKRLDELPRDYLEWLARECRSGSIRRRAAVLVAVDQDETLESPDPTPAAVALPGLIYEWEAAMRHLFGDDADAMYVAGIGGELLKRLCTRYTRKDWPE